MSVGFLNQGQQATVQLSTIYETDVLPSSESKAETAVQRSGSLRSRLSQAGYVIQSEKGFSSPLERQDYLALEREADADALVPQSNFKEEWLYLSHLKIVAKKYQAAAEIALLRGDREKTLELLKKSTELWQGQFFSSFGVDALEQAILKIESKGEENLAAELNVYLLDTIDKKMILTSKYLQEHPKIKGVAPQLISYWIKKADLLGKLGLEKSVQKDLYLNAAEAYLNEPELANQKCLAAILYEKAELDPILLKQKYQEAYEGLLGEMAKELEEIQQNESWLDEIVDALEAGEESVSFRAQKFPKDDPRRLGVFYYYFVLFCGSSQMFDFFANHGQNESKQQMQWIEKEFGYYSRILKLLMPLEEGAPIPSEKWDLNKEYDCSSLMFARFFALGDFLVTRAHSQRNATQAQEIQAKMDLLKPLMERYPDSLKGQCEEFFQGYRLQLENLFSPDLMKMKVDEIFEVVYVH